MKGKAFVEYESHENALKALAATNETSLDGRSIWVEFSGQAAGGYKGGAAAANNGEVTTLFVGNMSFKTEQNSLKNFFSKAGNVKDVRIALNEEGRPKGFAHVEFYSNADAVAALKLAG